MAEINFFAFLLLAFSPTSMLGVTSADNTPAITRRTNLGSFGSGDSFDGSLLAIDPKSDTVRYWSFRPREQTIEKVTTIAGVFASAFDPSTNSLVSIRYIGSDESILEKRKIEGEVEDPIWLMPDGWRAFAIAGNNNGDVAIAFEDDIQKPAEGYDWRQRRVGLAIINRGGSKLAWKGHVADKEGGMNLVRISLSGDARFVAIAGWKNGLLVHDLEKRVKKWSMRPDNEVSTADVAFTPNSNIVLSGGSAGTVFAHRLQDGKVIRSFSTLESWQRVGSQRIVDIAVSPNGKLVAACTEPVGLTVVWEIESGKEIYRCKHGSPTWLVSFARDNNVIATMSTGIIKFWKFDSDS